MAWTSPLTWRPGLKVTAAIFNPHIRDNLNVLKTRIRDTGLLRKVAAKSAAASGNVTTGETNLTGYSYVVPAAELADGEGYSIKACGVLANNANAKTVRIAIGAQKVVLFTTATAVAANVFTIDILVLRTGAAAAIVFGISTFGVATGGVPTVNHIAAIVGSLAWASATTLQLTGQATATNDIVMATGQFSDRLS